MIFCPFSVHWPSQALSYVTALAYNPQGTLLASGSIQYFIRIWDLSTGSLKFAVSKEYEGTVIDCWVVYTATSYISHHMFSKFTSCERTSAWYCFHSNSLHGAWRNHRAIRWTHWLLTEMDRSWLLGLRRGNLQLFSGKLFPNYLP